jgi:hypothetical protein
VYVWVRVCEGFVIYEFVYALFYPERGGCALLRNISKYPIAGSV